MKPLLFQPTLEQTATLPSSSRAILKGALPAIASPRADVQIDEGYFEPFANRYRNSRVPFPLRLDSWEVRWRSDLPPSSRPRFLFPLTEGYLIQDERAWQLFGPAGKLMGNAALDLGGCVVVDPRNGLFYHGDPSGLLSGRRLRDGVVEFRFFSAGGQGWMNSSFQRDGRQFHVISHEPAEMTHHGPIRTPDLTMFESYNLGDPLQVDDDGLLLSREQTSKLFCRDLPLCIVGTRDGVAITSRNYVCLTGPDWKITRHLTGEFEPIALSTDEADRMYLLNRGSKELRLWVVSADGDLLATADLPSSLPVPPLPPIVGYDHRIHVALADRLCSFSLEGRILATQRMSQPITGAVVTADDCLVVVSGREVVALRPNGEKTVLYAADEDLVTPAVLTPAGTMMVASRNKIICLGAH